MNNATKTFEAVNQNDLRPGDTVHVARTDGSVLMGTVTDNIYFFDPTTPGLSQGASITFLHSDKVEREVRPAALPTEDGLYTDKDGDYWVHTATTDKWIYLGVHGAYTDEVMSSPVQYAPYTPVVITGSEKDNLR